MQPLSFAAVALTLLAAAPAAAGDAASSGPNIEQVLTLAGQNNVANPRSFWRSDDGAWAGVAGYGTDGTWYEVVVGADGTLVRASHDDGAAFPVTLAQAVATATENGLARIDTLRLGGGSWFAMGTDASGARRWLVIDATSGAVVKQG